MQQSKPFILRWLNRVMSMVERHLLAFVYVITVVLPAIFRTGTRPVIFNKHSGIGDIICTFPTALELKKRHPKAEFIYNCCKDYIALPKLAGVTDRVTSIETIGIVGYWYRFLLSGYYHFASNDDNEKIIPTDVYIKDFGRPFGVELQGSHPEFRIEPHVLFRMKAILHNKHLLSGPLVVIHPGPSWPVREWLHENWTSLVEELRLHGLSNVIHLGVGKTVRFGEVEAASIPGTLSLVNQLSLEEACALISLANLFIGIDSGLLHIAAALRIPSVGLWGPTSPHLRFLNSAGQTFVISRVECQGCQHRFPRLHWYTGCPYDIKCMKSIFVDDVLRAALERIVITARG